MNVRPRLRFTEVLPRAAPGVVSFVLHHPLLVLGEAQFEFDSRFAPLRKAATTKKDVASIIGLVALNIYGNITSLFVLGCYPKIFSRTLEFLCRTISLSRHCEGPDSMRKSHNLRQNLLLPQPWTDLSRTRHLSTPSAHKATK